MYYIYKITNTINGKNYIGYTCNPKSRWASHKSESKSCRSKQNIHKAMAKHGVENFTFQVLLEHEDKEYVLKTMEDKFIQEYNAMGPYGYNMAPGGGGGGSKSIPTRRLISLKNTGRIPWNKGLKGLVPWNKGLTKEDPRVQKNLDKAHSTRKDKDGYHAWNKGLTKEEDKRVATNGQSISKTRKQRKIKPWNTGLSKHSDERVAKNGQALAESRKGKKDKQT